MRVRFIKGKFEKSKLDRLEAGGGMVLLRQFMKKDSYALNVRVGGNLQVYTKNNRLRSI